jgi:hypothetical protein
MGTWAMPGYVMTGFASACSWELLTAAPDMLHCIWTQCTHNFTKPKQGD